LIPVPESLPRFGGSHEAAAEVLWREEDSLVGRIFKANAAPVGRPWMWTLAFGHHEDRTPTHGYAANRHGCIRQKLAAGIGHGKADDEARIS
jgi:hypothetical protein